VPDPEEKSDSRQRQQNFVPDFRYKEKIRQPNPEKITSS